MASAKSLKYAGLADVRLYKVQAALAEVCTLRMIIVIIIIIIIIHYQHHHH